MQLSFDMSAYREKLQNVQSHYASINIPPGYSEEQIKELWRLRDQQGMSEPPYRIALPNRIVTKLNRGVSNSYKVKNPLPKVKQLPAF